MEWNCVCGQKSNSGSSCSNCGRSKPTYLGVSIHVIPLNEFNNQNLAKWLLMVANKYVTDVEKAFDEFQSGGLFKLLMPQQTTGDMGANNRAEKKRDEYLKNCRRGFDLAAKAMQSGEDCIFKDASEVTITPKGVQSQCCFYTASYFFHVQNFSKAIEYYQQAYNLEPNQAAIFNLALSTLYSSTEGTGLFGSKNAQASKIKREQEIEMFKNAVLYAPYSRLGIEAAQILFDQYGVLLDLKDFTNTKLGAKIF